MIRFVEKQDRKYGKLMMEHWEQDMKALGYEQPMEMVMIKAV